MRWETGRERRKSLAERIQGTHGNDLIEFRSERGFKEMDDPWLIQFAEIDGQWLLRRGLVPGVEAPIAGDDIEPAVAIEIGGGHAIPPARNVRQTAFAGAFGQLAFLVLKDTDGTPFAGQYSSGQPSPSRSLHTAPLTNPQCSSKPLLLVSGCQRPLSFRNSREDAGSG